MLNKFIFTPAKLRYFYQIVALTSALSLLSASDVFSQSSTLFQSSQLSGAVIAFPTSLHFGPDGRLYVSQQNGEIKVFTIQKNDANDYQVVATETILLIKDIPNHNDNGNLNSAIIDRQVTGLLVTGTAINPVIYVSSSDPREGGGGNASDKNLDTNSGILSKLTWNGTVWTKMDVVLGLPRSEENHSSNGLQLDKTNNILYLAQGGHTNAGAPSNNFAFLTEYALSAAILSIDLTMIENNFGGSYTLPTLDDPTRANTGPNGSDVNDPFGGNDGLNQAKLVVGGPVQIHSPGYRNAYDLVITKAPGKEGRMYSIDNGANGGWGGHPDQEGAFGDPLTTNVTNNYVVSEPGSTGPGPNDAKVNNLDNLHLVSKPGMTPIYKGHPNPIRANPAGAGLYWFDNATSTAHFQLSPTVDWPPVPLSMANPVEGDFRNPGVDDGALYTWTSSTNGITEYTSNKFFGGTMVGDLIAASFNGSLYRIKLVDDGTAVDFVQQMASGFGSIPLDVTAQGIDEVFEGSVWVANYASSTITIFEPKSGCSGVLNLTVIRSGNTLTALETNATYQWINCADNTDIAGETGQTFTASEIGIYAVRITKASCADISSCVEIAETDPGFSIRINAGGGQQVYGTELWESDQFYENGTSNSTTAAIVNTEKDNLYQTERFANNLYYEIPVPGAGKYHVKLHFAEINWTEAGKRVFNVNVENGQGSLTNYDIFLAAGGANTAITESFVVNVNDGSLSLEFLRILDQGKVSAIELSSCEDPVIDSFLTPQPSVCEGSPATLIVSGSLGSATAWHLYTGSCGGTLITSNATGIFEVNPVANTTYYVRGEGGCSPPGACVSVDIQIKTVPASITRSGNTFIASPTGATYQWINCDGNTNIAGETSRFFTPEEAGSYAVRVTQNGCSSNSECVDYVIVSLLDEMLGEITIHPNPARSSVKVRLPNLEKYSIKITDAQGRSVLISSATDTNELELNIETLTRGLYFVHIQSNRVMKTVKLIVN